MVEVFFTELDTEGDLLNDTRWHTEALAYWHDNIFDNLDAIKPEELKYAIGKYTIRSRNTKPLAEYAITEFKHFKQILKDIKNISGNPLPIIERMLNSNDELHIKGAGYFFISQLLAAAYPKDFGVLQEDIGTILSELELTDVPIKSGTAKAYLYANDICKRIYQEKLTTKIRRKDYGFADGFELAVVHNFLWHYKYYKDTGKWF
jgi:thermostable 8-oxoguanine DNA glycosylase